MEHNPTSPVTIDVHAEDGSQTAVLKVNGPLTIHNFFEFQDLSRQQTAPLLLVDLSDTPYIDSAALGSLIGLHVSRQKHGWKYALVGANDRLQNLFRLTNVSEFLITYPTSTEAEAALG